MLWFGYDLSVSPKHSCVTISVSNVKVLGHSGTFKRCGLTEGSRVIQDATLGRN
jgi:hypothetical protein